MHTMELRMREILNLWYFDAELGRVVVAVFARGRIDPTNKYDVYLFFLIDIHQETNRC